MEDKASLFQLSLFPTNSVDQINPQPLKLKKPRLTDNDTQNASASTTSLLSKEEVAIQKQDSREEVVEAGDCGRERLKRHRVEVAGRVWIPEMWGQEELLKDWINCSTFDAPFVPSRIMTARAALVQQGRRALLVD